MTGFGRPQQGELLRLGLRNLYIVPTRFGWLWLAGAVMLLVAAIQTQSNGPLLLSFLMLGLMLLALHLTHFNLQGLELQAGDPPPGFAGTPLAYPLLLRSQGRCEGLQLAFADNTPDGPHILAAGEQRLSVRWTPQRRGLQRPGRLRLFTTAPLGLFVCWSRWDPPRPQLVWPARRPGPVLQRRGGVSEAGAARSRDSGREGSDDWLELRPHRPGDSSSRLAWKLLAQGRGRHSKRFATAQPQATLLAPDPAVPLEQALEHLSERICQLQASGEPYGLLLRDGRLEPDTGTAQRDRCLTALAEW
ncbi:MAG: DUF58 domain-containing protein [Synechococcaceae cyanobacterium]|nr:DUF58 domain-containing protein [Synechococcaceae cyanobacterium]